MDRRQFILATAAVVASCSDCLQAARESSPIDAGPSSNYAKDGVYNQFQDYGFFIVRKGGKLEVFSSYCTHRRCKLREEPDHSFYCKCHGSTFDPDGRVTLGPARKDLAKFTTKIDEKSHLIVYAQSS